MEGVTQAAPQRIEIMARSDGFEPPTLRFEV
jgi:hypothetical protein